MRIIPNQNIGFQHPYICVRITGMHFEYISQQRDSCYVSIVKGDAH